MAINKSKNYDRNNIILRVIRDYTSSMYLAILIAPTTQNTCINMTKNSNYNLTIIMELTNTLPFMHECLCPFAWCNVI